MTWLAFTGCQKLHLPNVTTHAQNASKYEHCIQQTQFTLDSLAVQPVPRDLDALSYEYVRSLERKAPPEFVPLSIEVSHWLPNWLKDLWFWLGLGPKMPVVPRLVYVLHDGQTLEMVETEAIVAIYCVRHFG